MYELAVKFSQDFEKRYNEYKMRILDVQKTTRGQIPQQIKETNNNEFETKQENGQKIIKITFIKPRNENGNYKFAINENWLEIKNVRRASERLETLIRVADEKNLVDFNKDIFDYINFNNNCPLYHQGKYKLTTILEKEGNYFRISLAVKTEIISEVTYNKRLNSSRRT